MQVGMIGLGRMGAGMAQRLATGGHAVAGYDPQEPARERFAAEGGRAYASLDELLATLQAPRILWMMVPAGAAVDATLQALQPKLARGDVVIDGGNSNYRDTQRRGQALRDAGIYFVDCGTSGGIWGLREGYSLMIGGDTDVIERLRPLFATLAPAAESGWGRVGPVGAGHFVKMVHNGIEYGMMQAYAEGFSVLEHKQEFALDLHAVAAIWGDGSVVRSWLLERIGDALRRDATLADIAPVVADSGEGRWTVAEAIELGVPAPVITQALIARLRSRDAESFADRLLAAMRHEFGGHAVTKT
jgi:6-phosphogluconate dehydrogenase